MSLITSLLFTSLKLDLPRRQTLISPLIFNFCRSQWPRGLRCGSAAVHLLGLWVRISAGAWMSEFVSAVCCQVDVSATGWSLAQRIPTECGVSECDLETSRNRRPWPTGAVEMW